MPYSMDANLSHIKCLFNHNLAAAPATWIAKVHQLPKPKPKQHQKIPYTYRV